MKVHRGIIRKGEAFWRGHKYPILTEGEFTEGQDVKFKIVHKFDKVVNGRCKHKLHAEIL